MKERGRLGLEEKKKEIKKAEYREGEERERETWGGEGEGAKKRNTGCEKKDIEIERVKKGKMREIQERIESKRKREMESYRERTEN